MSTTTKKFSGWSVLAGCFLLLFFGNAIIAGTTALFMAPVIRTFGFDAAAYSVITLLGSLFSAVSSTMLAGKMQKGNMKIIILICMVIAGAAYAGMGLCTQLWHFYAMFAICNIGYGGIGQLPVAMLITAWFDDKRPTAMALAFCGNGLGTAIWSMIFSSIIAGSPMGWVTCYFLGGAIIILVGGAVTLFMIKKCPQDFGQEAYLQDNSKKTDAQKAAAKPRDTWQGVSKGIAFKSPAFFLMSALILLLGCAVTGVSTHVINFLVLQGWDQVSAGSVLSVFSLVGIVGLLVGGLLFEKLGPRNGIIVACLSYIIGIAALFLAGGNHIFGYLYAIFFALGGMMPRLVPALLTSTLFGTKDYAGIYAILNLLFLVGCSVGAVLTGIIYNMAGYPAAWITYIVFVALMIVCTIFALIDGKRLRAKYPNSPAEKAAE